MHLWICYGSMVGLALFSQRQIKTELANELKVFTSVSLVSYVQMKKIALKCRVLL